MKIERLISILIILLQNKKVTASFLAERFEVSKRTIYRDITDLCLAGIPIITTTGTEGGISIPDDYKIDKTFFNEKELHAILSGLLSLNSISNDHKYQAIIEKFSKRKQNIYTTNHMMIDLSSHYKETLAPKIKDFNSAIEAQQTVRFDYHSAKGEREVVLEPYIIVFQWANWYVLGFECGSEQCKLYKLNRMLNLEVMQESFSLRDIPQDSLQFKNFYTDEIKAVILFDSSLRYRLIEEYGNDSFIETKEGYLRFEFPFTNKDYLLRWVLSFDDKAELLEPHELRTALWNSASKLMKKYKE